jgi:crossover junction endodeoxyribonuclease RuvC
MICPLIAFIMQSAVLFERKRLMRILGLDPSLSSTGWAIIEVENNRLRYVADDFIKTDTKKPLPERLAEIYRVLDEVINLYHPQEAAIEKVFLNSNPSSTIKLGMARGVVIMAPALHGIPVSEYEPNKVKKAVVGVGHADKNQVETMVKILLPGCKPKNNDSSDALAMALCHFQYRGVYTR